MPKRGESKGIEIDRDSDEYKILLDPRFIELKKSFQQLRKDFPDSTILSELTKKEMFIPATIFRKKISGLEIISKYLVENCNLTLKRIGDLLGRSNKNIWHAYDSSKKKMSEEIKVDEALYLIPISVFKNKFSVLENIVVYLKEEYLLNFKQISRLIERNERTVWTVYNRAKKKK